MLSSLCDISKPNLIAFLNLNVCVIKITIQSQKVNSFGTDEFAKWLNISIIKFLDFFTEADIRMFHDLISNNFIP